MEWIEQVINRQNMMRALNQVRQNKSSAGVDRMPLGELYDYLTKNRERSATLTTLAFIAKVNGKPAKSATRFIFF